MGPPENATRHPENQEARRRHLASRPRVRRCLLKGCDQRFHPRQECQRYCSEECRKVARKWSCWKAQARYRDTAAGRQKRNGQSQRYRERVKSRQPADPEAISEAARVITTEDSFRPLLRPARLLRAIRKTAAKSLAALLFARVSACAGAGRRAGAALETSSRLNPEILIHIETRLTFSMSDASGVSPARPALGAPAGSPSCAATAVVGVSGRIGPADTHRGGGDRRPGRSLRRHRRL